MPIFDSHLDVHAEVIGVSENDRRVFVKSLSIDFDDFYPEWKLEADRDIAVTETSTLNIYIGTSFHGGFHASEEGATAI